MTDASLTAAQQDLARAYSGGAPGVLVGAIERVAAAWILPRWRARS